MNRFDRKNILSLILLFLFACSSSHLDNVERQIAGKYYFMMYDSTDSNITDGDMQIKETDNTNLSGSYKLIKKYMMDFPAYGILTGTFEGSLKENGGKVFLNMNPKMADNNVFVYANLNGDSLTGRWTYSTMKGIKDSGKFRAVKVVAKSK